MADNDWSGFPAADGAHDWSGFPAASDADAGAAGKPLAAPPPTWGDAAKDALKQTGPALAEGAAYLGGGFHDIYNALMAGTAYLGKKYGPASLSTPDPKVLARLDELVQQQKAFGAAHPNAPTIPDLSNVSLPTSSDILSGVKKATGDFPDPTTGTGSLVRNTIPFAVGAAAEPAATLPAFAKNLVKWGVLPGVASEAAGDATAGTAAEPWARAAASLAAPIVGGRVISPLPTAARTTANITALRNEGITPTAGQATARRPLQYLEAQLTSDKNEAQAGQVTSAALSRVGMGNEDHIEPGQGGTIDRMFSSIGQRFDNLQARHQMNGDTQMGNDLVGTWQDYASLTPPSQRAPVVENTIREIGDAVANNGGSLPGDTYQALRSRLSRLQRGTSDPQLGTALGGIGEAMDDAMERTLAASGSRDLGAWQAVRRDYRNALVIEKAAGAAGPGTAAGYLTPANLASAAKSVYGKRVYLRGQDDFSDLTRPAVASLPTLPDSGMAHRAAVTGALTALGGGAGYYLGSKANGDGDNESPIGGLLLGEAGGGALLARMLGRPALMNPITQAYLRNQVLARTPGLMSLPGATTAAKAVDPLLSGQ